MPLATSDRLPNDGAVGDRAQAATAIGATSTIATHVVFTSVGGELQAPGLSSALEVL